MGRLFSVYVVENNQKILLGGLADPGGRHPARGQAELLAMARLKFSDLPADARLILQEEGPLPPRRDARRLRQDTPRMRQRELQGS